MFRKEETFQKTPIGTLPDDWEPVKLGELGELQYGYTTSAVKEDNGTKFLRITDINEDGSINWKEVPYCNINPEEFSKYALQNGDILFARIGATAGKTAIVRENIKGIFASYLIRLKVQKQDVFPEFVFYETQSETYWSQARRQREGQLKKGINATMLSDFLLPLPPFKEQRAIVGVLGVVDSAIEYTNRVIAKSERLKRGLMQQLLTRGIGHTATKQTPIGNIPKDWQVAPLGENVDFRNGINFNNEQRTSTGTLTIDVRNMYGEGIYVALEDLYRVNISDNEDCLLRKGDILFVRSSMKREGAGWASLFEGSSQPVTFCSFIIRARLKDQSQILPEFLAHYLRSDFARRKLVANAGQVAISNITQDSLSSLLFPIPPIEEQNKIAKILTTVDEKSKLEKIEKAKIERIKQALMDLLLTGKIRIKVD